MEPSLVSNFVNKWVIGRLKPQNSHLPAKSSLKHYNHVQKIIQLQQFSSQLLHPRGELITLGRDNKGHGWEGAGTGIHCPAGSSAGGGSAAKGLD